MCCCAGTDYKDEDIDGKCPTCDEPTVDGDAFVRCGYSPVQCKTCGYAPCDQSC